MKCDGCIFLSEFRDMGASCPVCVRADARDLVADIAACNAPGPCPWHITRAQVKELQGTSSPAPGLSEEKATRILAKIQADDAASESLQAAMAKVGEAAASLGEAFAHFADSMTKAGVDFEE